MKRVARCNKTAAQVLAMVALMYPILCSAYRPFDSTDADVAKPHEWEIEFGPLGYLEQPARRLLTVPSFVLNYGIGAETELVAQGEVLHPIAGTDDGGRRFVDDGLFVKTVWREGSLQDAAGPSLATECGVLLPEVHGDTGVGASLAAIASQQWEFGTLHVNAAIGSTRTHHLDLFGGSILEGPARWKVRPVAEVYFERTEPETHTLSRLIGAIWRHSERLALDLGLRWAREGGEAVRELRAGFTWSLTEGR